MPVDSGQADREGAPADREPCVLLDAARDGEAVPVATAGKDDHELVAARPVNRSLAADHSPQRLRDLLDVRVACEVPLGVVDPLEAVEVDREQHERSVRRRPLRDRRREGLVERAVVAEAGEAVGARLQAELLDAFVVLGRRRAHALREQPEAEQRAEHGGGERRPVFDAQDERCVFASLRGGLLERGALRGVPHAGVRCGGASLMPALRECDGVDGRHHDACHLGRARRRPFEAGQQIADRGGGSRVGPADVHEAALATDQVGERPEVGEALRPLAVGLRLRDARDDPDEGEGRKGDADRRRDEARQDTHGG